MFKIKNIPINFVEDLSELKKVEVINSHKLINYINNNLKNKNVEIKSIRIDKVNFFGKKIGFIYLESEIYIDGIQVPGIGFIRGDSVAILLVLTAIIDNEVELASKYTILVEQYRPNVGKFKKGIPAGMIDEEGQVTSTAIKEIEEEVGELNIVEEDLQYLIEFSPSSGGCDENVILYAVEKDIDYDELMKFQDRITGSENENEVIKLDVLPLIDLENANKGSKTWTSYNIFKEL
jgi:8-oxo-dGTP pyrophosphatase MutT (NUDIX family)